MSVKLILKQEQSDDFYTQSFLKNYDLTNGKSIGRVRQYEIKRNNALIAEIETRPSGDNLELQINRLGDTDSFNTLCDWIDRTYNTPHGSRCYFVTPLDKATFYTQNPIQHIIKEVLSANEKNDSPEDEIMRQSLNGLINKRLPKLTPTKGNGAGRKEAGKKAEEAKLKLLDLTEQVKSSCRNYEQAVAKAYEMLDPEYLIWIDGIPAWPTVKGWRKLRNKPDE